MTIKLATVGGVPKGALENYTFPSKAELEKDVPWSAVVRNIGGLGSIAFGIVNTSSNPEVIIVTYGGTEYTIELGYYLRLSRTDIPSDGTMSVDGTIRFSVKGTYSIKLWAMHLEGTTWIYDQEITKSVVVAPPVVPPTPPSLLDQIIASINEHPLEYAIIGAGAFLVWTAQKQQKKG